MKARPVDPIPAGRRLPLAAWLVFGVFVVIAYWWLGEHRPHAVALLPYLLLLACPLMHLFRHDHGPRHADKGRGEPLGTAELANPDIRRAKH